MAEYREVCHTECYWLNTLWHVGEVYEGNLKPEFHFSEDGKLDKPLPPPEPGLDPRSNKVLRATLRKAPFNFDAPKEWSRKKVWAKLQEFERAEEMDELTSEPSTEVQTACGFLAKNSAGAAAHERQCEKCIRIKG
jgi:hypothetical protein